MATSKTLYEKVIEAFPELEGNHEVFITQQIILQNDSDGTGDYIRKWDYSSPVPESLAKFIR